jgi:hypothetical protein
MPSHHPETAPPGSPLTCHSAHSLPTAASRGPTPYYMQPMQGHHPDSHLGTPNPGP